MMKRGYFPFRYLIAFISFFIVLPTHVLHAGMSSYCQQPPYIIQNAAPNILFMESTSKNMNRFAYYDGFLDPGIIPTTDNLCITDNCTKFTRPGTYPAYKYTGFFNPDYWYTYSNADQFVRSNAKSDGRPARGWDGNFLNWLTMRRYDILQKVLIGKKRAADNWEGQGAADNTAGLWKRITNAQNYIDNTLGSGTVTFRFNIQSGGQTSDFTLSGGGTSGTFKVRVAPVTEKSTGVFQDVFPRARAGIAQASGDGMRVWSKIDFSFVQADINQIINTPSSQLGNQGLGNQLWGIAGYFANTTSIPTSSSWSPAPDASNWNYMIPNKDPLNYNNQYFGCASNYVIYITDGDPSGDGNLPNQLKNYANTNPLRSPFNCGGTGATLPNTCQGGTIQGVTFPSYTFPSATGNVSGLEDVALWAHTTDLRSSTIGYNDISGKQNLTLYVVNAFGSASTYLKYVAINGGFDDLGTGIPDTRSTWDKGGSGVPYNYYEAKDQDQLQSALTEAVNSILKRATSGTAASVLASGEGSGANLLQAVFYPRRRFSNDIILWAGSLQNLWYYVDPRFGNATVREETVDDGILNLQTDRIVQFFFDNTSQTTKVARTQDVNGDGQTLVALDNVFFEDMDSLWEAGKKLYYLAPSARNIKTTLNGSSFTPFNESYAASLSSDLAPDAGQTAAGIIRYTLGYDNIALRNRTVEIGTDNNVWKLGDILTSTPRVVSSIPLVKYYETYSDRTYGPASDNTTFTGGTTYKNRGMVFAGGNDGILHAFKLGKLEQKWTGQVQLDKARLTNDNVSVPLGQEMWGFIPRGALPYLKYLSDNSYCHLAYVDLPPYVFDASIGGNPTDTRTAGDWRTILIGGMRTGGACANSCSAGSDCVQTPATDKGFSSYFALDVTDPTNPSLLWEFSDPNLGFSTTGPAILRINALNTTTSPPSRDRSLNGEWYVVFGSGPTGPIDNTFQFLGRSNQPLRIFIRSLKTGNLVETINTSIPLAFAGSMLNATADYNLDYQDDVVYIPYVKKSGTTWTDGGVLRLVPRVSPTTNSVTWAWGEVIGGIGPVTSSVAHLQNDRNGNAWLYFGTGRYYYDHPPGQGSVVSPDIDDPLNTRAIFGVKEPCYSASSGFGFFDSNCTTTMTLGQLDDVTNIANVKAESVANQAGYYNGWYLNLDPPDNYTYDGVERQFYAERVITDPLASTNGLVFFTTFKPYGDYCAIGGKSFLWALRYNTGGAPPVYSLQGKALLQVSTAAIEQLDLSTAFSGGADSTLHKGGRRSYAMEGVPPVSQGLSILSPPPPLKRILHMKER